jgi:hypothetical protein
MITDWECEVWTDAYWEGFSKMEFLALSVKAQFCPICGRDCGEAEFEPDDSSVGIFGVSWYAICNEHDGFTTWDDGTQEMEEEDATRGW